MIYNGNPICVVCCPRCGRLGVVERDDQEPDEFVIVWADPRVGNWRDSGITGAEIADPTFGCGYDDESAMAAWDGPRSLHALFSGDDAVRAESMPAERPIRKVMRARGYE